MPQRLLQQFLARAVRHSFFDVVALAVGIEAISPPDEFLLAAMSREYGVEYGWMVKNQPDPLKVIKPSRPNSLPVNWKSTSANFGVFVTTVKETH